jgi:hypothetical protein
MGLVYMLAHYYDMHNAPLCMQNMPTYSGVPG